MPFGSLLSQMSTEYLAKREIWLKQKTQKPVREGKYAQRAKSKQKNRPPAKGMKILNLVQKMIKLDETGIFSVPVDVVQNPTYLNIVAKPMDFRTVEHNLKSGQYPTVDKFAEDVRLVFKNCKAFNPPGTQIRNLGDELEREFERYYLVSCNTPAPVPQSQIANVASA